MAFKTVESHKSERIRIWVTKEQKAQIEQEAAARLLDVSSYALKRMLGKQTPVQFEYIVIDQLEKHISEIKRIFREAGSHELIAQQLGPAVDALIQTSLALGKQRGRK